MAAALRRRAAPAYGVTHGRPPRTGHGDRWQHGPTESTVRPGGLAGDAQIWLIDPDAPGPYGDMALLSADERRRAARFFRATNRREYVAAHALLRTKLGERLGMPAHAVPFIKGPHGRPELGLLSDLSFSLSHTTGLVGCAIARGVTIGLDLEPLRPLDAAGMAHGILDPTERADVARRAGAGQWQRFLQYWTLKEAALKVRGTGLTLPADGARVRWAQDQQPRIVALPDGAAAQAHAARLWRLGARRPAARHSELDHAAVDRSDPVCVVRDLAPSAE